MDTQPSTVSTPYLLTPRNLIRTICELDFATNPNQPNPYHPAEMEYWIWQDRHNELMREKPTPRFVVEDLRKRLQEFYR